MMPVDFKTKRIEYRNLCCSIREFPDAVLYVIPCKGTNKLL